MTTEPTTFAEGQRALALKLAAGAGLAIGFGMIALAWIFWRGGWAEATEPQRLTALLVIAVGGLAGMIAVIMGLLVGGPVGRMKASIGKDGGSFETEDRE